MPNRSNTICFQIYELYVSKEINQTTGMYMVTPKKANKHFWITEKELFYLNHYKNIYIDRDRIIERDN